MTFNLFNGVKDRVENPSIDIIDNPPAAGKTMSEVKYGKVTV
jgi:hypothetical protein